MKNMETLTQSADEVCVFCANTPDISSAYHCMHFTWSFAEHSFRARRNSTIPGRAMFQACKRRLVTADVWVRGACVWRSDNENEFPSIISYLVSFHQFYVSLHSVHSFINPYPTAFPYGNGMVLHFYKQQESSTTKTVHKVINKRLKTYV